MNGEVIILTSFVPNYMVEIAEGLESHKEFFDKLFYFLPANELNEPKETEKLNSETPEPTEKQTIPKSESGSKPKYHPIKIKPKNTRTRPGFEGTKFIKKKTHPVNTK